MFNVQSVKQPASALFLPLAVYKHNEHDLYIEAILNPRKNLSDTKEVE